MRQFPHPDRPGSRSWYGVAPRTLEDAFPHNRSPLLSACDVPRDPWMRVVCAIAIMILLGLILALRG